MSQHYFETVHGGMATTILMGWDRPLQGHFMVIYKATNEEEPFWSNLDCEVSHPKSLDPFLMVLSELGIYLPAQMTLEIEDDRTKNMGNKTVYHNVIEGIYQRDEK